MRLIYENSRTLADEAEIASHIATSFDCEMKKLPPLYCLDYLAVRRHVPMALIEIKKRNAASDTYPDIMMSMHKYIRGTELSRTLALPMIFVVGLDDGVFWVKMKPIIIDYELRWGGRTADTRDHGDIEPVVHIPMGEFRRAK